MTIKNGLSRVYKTMQDAYWNAVETCPEMMGVDPQNPPKRPPVTPDSAGIRDAADQAPTAQAGYHVITHDEFLNYKIAELK